MNKPNKRGKRKDDWSEVKTRSKESLEDTWKQAYYMAFVG